uniref:Uncharacterized protein n=1 Tax=Arundo donax TaxID=35708 RepID=A0A0A9CCP8_ARUDO
MFLSRTVFPKVSFKSTVLAPHTTA